MTSDQESPLKRTPLYDTHVRAGARIVPFAGWEMPLQYSGIIDEVAAVRTSAGMFDVSHMGEFHASGPGALAWLNGVATNDVSRLEPGRAQYSLLLNEEAGIVDDILVYRMADEEWMLVVNAGNLAGDWEWLEGRLLPGVVLEDSSELTSLVALQGPLAQEILQPFCSGPLQELRRFGFAAGEVAGVPAIVSRTGYTGEDGFEIFVQEKVETVWAALATDERVRPCGLGARDILRIEAGNVLYGHEIWDEVNPLSAGLMWTVALDKPPFIGSQALQTIVEAGAALTLCGIRSSGRIPPRQDYVVRKDGEEVGFITSGVYSPTLSCPIGMAYLPPELSDPGTEVDVVIRGRDERMEVAALPFYRARRS